MEWLTNLSAVEPIPELIPQRVQDTAVGFRSWYYSVIQPTFPIVPTTVDFTFEIKPCPQSMMIPKESYILIEVCIKRKDGEVFDADDEPSMSNLAPLMFFSDVSIESLGIQFEEQHSYAHVLNYINANTNFNTQQKNSILRAAGWEPGKITKILFCILY